MTTVAEHRFRADDGAELFYRHWPAATPSGKTLLLFHRGHEHSARWAETVQSLNLPDVDVFAWDQRGHGESPGERGSAVHLAQIVRDANDWARHLITTHGIILQDSVVMAHSVGAVVATAWVHDYAPPVRGLVLATPAFDVKLYVPLAVPALRLKQKLFGPGYVKSYVKSKVLTHDETQARAYDADPKIFRQIAVNILLDLADTSKRLVQDAGTITTPTLILTAGRDWIVRIDTQTKFLERLGSGIKQLEVFPEMYHALFHEAGRMAVVDRARKFIVECFGRPPQNGHLLDADQSGATRVEYDTLKTPNGLKWNLTRLSLNTVGRASRGIRIGWRDGFDSGVMLDHVYRNQARGLPLIGTFIDRQFLNAIGWRGIRIRGEHLRKMLEETIRAQHAAGMQVHILDIAAGPGRYVLETMKAVGDIPVRATLRDYKQANLDAARALTSELGLTERVTIVQGDAFDRSSYATITPKPTIGIISGLLELFPENEWPRRALRGMADAIAPGGTLLYTCQPWHPQVEFIARVLSNREGRAWIMRRRSQAEMDQLVAAAGFSKDDQRIDPWGIFTVSSARQVKSLVQASVP
jgi:alpha-beta hydrolase superfamily lysophospholipase/SAM-dependent methyltransferase